MSCAVQWLMPFKVDDDNNAVNGNMEYARWVASPRTYHHGNLRATLLEHAEAALAAGSDLSLRELARQAGVSHGAPRRHFADKQALLDALAVDGFERLGAALALAESTA